MSAIGGVWRFDGSPEHVSDCSRVLDAQALYGPHSAARWDGDGVSLGRRLYRLLPEDVFDLQPVVARAGALVLVADVRLDNRPALVRELQISPDAARQMADSSVLLAAWDRWEEEALQRIVGDYAFALWDGRRGRLTLARDPVGHRPLFYHLSDKHFAFASMPKGLHALPEIPIEPNLEAVALRYAMIPGRFVGSETFFAGIHRVQSGCLLSVTREGATSRRYWNPAPRPAGSKSDDEYVAGLREQLDLAVGSRLRRVQGEVGAHLSAGWAADGRNLHAFTAVPREGYDRPAPQGRFVDEGPLAALTADLSENVRHALVPSAGRSHLASLERDYFAAQEPIYNPCNAVWMRAINERAKAQGVSVLLTGQLGNLTLTPDGMDWFPQLFAEGRWRTWRREAAAMVREGPRNWRGMIGLTLGPWLPPSIWRAWDRIKGRRSQEMGALAAINDELAAELDLAGRAREADRDAAIFGHKNALAATMNIFRDADDGAYLKGVLAEYGIDQRDPTSDRRLIEFSLSVPMNQLVRDGSARFLARRALSDRLPEAVLAETRRGYQAADWHERLTAERDELAAEIDRLATNAVSSKLLDVARLRKLIDQWPEDGWETEDAIDAYRTALLRGISMGHFLRKASGLNS